MALSQPTQSTQQQLRSAAPRFEPWASWYARKGRELRQGMHLLFVGPTQSGKTTLCRLMARYRGFVVVLGTKPKDPSLDAYIAEGYVRIDHWPPTKADFRKGDFGSDEARFILWPQMIKREDLRRYRDVYLKCLGEIFVDGRWTIVADEGLWLASRKGLDLGDALSDLSYGSASNKVSLYLLLQRPSGVPRITWSSVSDAFVFHGGVTNDVRELASLGVYDPRAVTKVIQSLEGHQFLDLPCRGGARWSVSEVDLSAI